MSHIQPLFNDTDLESFGRALDSAATHAQLTALFEERRLHEPEAELRGPKWKRLKLTLRYAQQEAGNGNPVLGFLTFILRPARFVEEPARFTETCERVNRVLAFYGLRFREDGKFAKVQAAATIDEARERAGRLRAELERRKVHPDVLRFCTAELVQENYFHAVLEATKSVSEKLRAKSGRTGDAGQLATETLSLGQSGVPVLALNSLQTETERSEQRGLTSLFVGMFGTFRNTTAHGPKVSWPVTEQDALDLLTLVSFLHRRLDDAKTTRPLSSNP